MDNTDLFTRWPGAFALVLIRRPDLVLIRRPLIWYRFGDLDEAKNNTDTQQQNPSKSTFCFVQGPQQQQ